VRALRGLRPRPDALEVDVLAVVAGLVLVQIAFIASTRSAMIAMRTRGSVPWLRISSRFQPAPTPNSRRPPERWSTLATSLAVVIGSRSMTRQMPLPMRSFDVAVGGGRVSATNRS
jgi:hypothetical protein